MKKLILGVFLLTCASATAQLPTLVSLENLPLKAIPDCDPDAMAWTAQSLQVLESDQADQALLFLQQADILDSACVQVKIAKAWVTFMSGDRPAGFNQMNRLLEDFGSWPDLVGMQITLMLAWTEMGPWWKKEGPYLTYLGRNPEFPGVDSISFTKHMLEQSSKAFIFLQSKGNVPDATQLLGFSRLKMKGKAWEEAMYWLELAPPDSLAQLEVFLSLAQCHFALNHPDKSLDYLDRALLLAPENPMIYSYQATLMKQMGDPRFQEKEAKAWFYQKAPLGCMEQPDLAMIDFLRHDEAFWMKKPEKAAEKWHLTTGKSPAFLLYWAIFLEPAPPPNVWAWLHKEYATHANQMNQWWEATLLASEWKEEYFFFYGTRVMEFQPQWFKEFVIKRLTPVENVPSQVVKAYGQLAMSYFSTDFLMVMLPQYAKTPAFTQGLMRQWVGELSPSAKQALLVQLNWSSFPFE